MSSRRSNKTGSRHDFPEEIIEDILVKLPVKSIVRFRSVSKRWLNLIKSSRFFNKHLNKSEETCLALFLIVRDKNQLTRRFLAFCLYDYLKERSTPQLLDGVDGFINISDRENQAPNYTFSELNYELPRLSRKQKSIIDLVGQCNGIMCLMTDYKMIMLVNPSLKEVKRLTVTPVATNPAEYCKLANFGFDLAKYCKLVGFGFDDVTMDFKVVRIVSLKPWSRQQRADVYSLRSNSWRELDEFPFVVDYAKKHSTFLNGVVHWCVGTKLLGWKMLTFNTATELFRQTEFPQGWYDSNDDNVPALFVLNQESLAFVSCQSHVLLSQFVNVWIWNKHENGDTWTKLYSIGPLLQLRPLSFSIKHKFLYETDPPGKLVLYDLVNQCSSEVCDLSRLYEHCLDPWLEMGVCRPSLVSINM